MKRSIMHYLVIALVLFFYVGSDSAYARRKKKKKVNVPLNAEDFRKGPYMVLPNDATKMKVIWQAVETRSKSYIEWGLTTGYGQKSDNLTESGSGKDGHMFSYTIADLKPSTRYHYRVVMDEKSDTGSFTTAPAASATKVTFYAYGDTRSSARRHNEVCSQIVKDYKSMPEVNQTFIIHNGDFNAKETENDWQYQYFSRNSKFALEMMRDLPVVAANGNHDNRYGGKLLRKYIPYSVPVKGYFYSVDYGPVHITIIDNSKVKFDPSSPQYEWLVKDLEATKKPWKIVMMHKPCYSAGFHAGSEGAIKHLEPLFKKYKVPLIFSGHNHYYARCEKDGITHITSGGGGAGGYKSDATKPFVVKTGGGLHFMRFDIDGDILKATVIDKNGNILDSFTIKSPK